MSSPSTAKDTMISGLVYRIGSDPVTETFSNELASLQKLVDGYIESVRLFDNVCLICNEEGLIHDLPRNRLVRGEWIRGNFFVVATDGPEFTSLTLKQAVSVKRFIT